jgi:hypothetical protein
VISVENTFTLNHICIFEPVKLVSKYHSSKLQEFIIFILLSSVFQEYLKLHQLEGNQFKVQTKFTLDQFETV